MQLQKSPQQRLVFFDNLRNLMVLLVIVFHSGASYTTMVAFWPFHDTQTSNFLEVLTILLDTFLMTVLFFIAGYFALPSLQKKGSKEFLKSKFNRLGIPWLVVTVSVLPILDYLHYFTQEMNSGSQPHGYIIHWILSMKKFFEFNIGRMHMSEYLNMTKHFYQRHMWFLSLLLLFFITFWLLYEVRKFWSSKADQFKPGDRSSKNKPVYLALLLVGFISILIFAAVKIIASSPADPLDLVWFSLGNIFQFQLAKMAFYIPAFALGVYAAYKKWFAKGQDFGRPAVWGWIVFILMGINMLLARIMVRAEEPALALQIAFLVFYPLWTISFLGLFVSIATRRLNTSSIVNQELASNSYNMYLAHYIFVMTLPLMLSSWTGGDVLIKFGLVSIASVILSYGTSRYMIKPHPKAVVFGLIGFNLFLMVFS